MRRAGADLVVLAAPVLQNIAVLDSPAAAPPGAALVTDVGSTKRTIPTRRRRCRASLRFIGGHPLAGAAAAAWRRRGRICSTAGRGSSPALTTAAAQRCRALAAFVAGLGAVPRTSTPTKHDRVLAYLSHLPQLTVSALMHVVGAARRRRRAGAGRPRPARHDPAGLEPGLAPGRTSSATNPDDIAAAIDDLIAALQEPQVAASRHRASSAMFDPPRGGSPCWTRS